MWRDSSVAASFQDFSSWVKSEVQRREADLAAELAAEDGASSGTPKGSRVRLVVHPHLLRSAFFSSSHHWCDRCSKEIASGWRCCEGCDWDICAACVRELSAPRPGRGLMTIVGGASALALVGVSVDVTVVGCVAEVHLVQRYFNARPEGVDAVWTLPVVLNDEGTWMASLEIERSDGGGGMLVGAGAEVPIGEDASVGATQTIPVGAVGPGGEVHVRLCYTVPVGPGCREGEAKGAAVDTIPLRLPACLAAGSIPGVRWPSRRRLEGSGSGLLGLHITVVVHSLGRIGRVACVSHRDECEVHLRPGGRAQGGGRDH